MSGGADGTEPVSDDLNKSHRVAVIAIDKDGKPTFWPDFETVVDVWRDAKGAVLAEAFPLTEKQTEPG